jgi:hypothetical protein
MSASYTARAVRSACWRCRGSMPRSSWRASPTSRWSATATCCACRHRAGAACSRRARRARMCAWPTRRSRPLDIAAAHPERQVVFFAIGFETTTPATAHLILEAQRLGLRNFSVYCNHVVTPAAIQSILDSPEVREWGQVRVDGFIGPSHVSAVIGSRPYEYFAEEYQRPVVIAGFEPLDVMQAIRMLVQQLNAGRACVENQFTRGVTREGNARRSVWSPRCSSCAELRVARPRRAALQRLAHQVRVAEFDAERRFAMEVGRCRRTRPASARRSSAASRSPPIARFSAPCARRAIRSAPAWCRRRAPAPPIISIVAARRGRPSDAHPAAGALLSTACRSGCTSSSRATATSCRSNSTFMIASPRGGRPVRAGRDSRAVSEARDSAVGLAAPSVSHRASGAAG